MQCEFQTLPKGAVGFLSLEARQEAFRQLSPAVAVACVMSTGKDQLVTRIPDVTPGLKVLGSLYPSIPW